MMADGAIQVHPIDQRVQEREERPAEVEGDPTRG